MPANEVIRIGDQFYILASSSLAEETYRVLKQGETFAVFDRHGDIRPLGFEDHGLFHEGTRFLSHSTIKLDGRSPLLLSSTVREDNDILVVDLTNPDFSSRSGEMIFHGTVHFERTIFLWKGCKYERLEISNYGLAPVEFLCSFVFDADFMDIFEVRGIKRKRRGDRLEPVIGVDSVVLGYKGLDGIVRKTGIHISPPPEEMRPNQAKILVRLEPQQKSSIYITVTCEIGHEETRGLSFESAFQEARKAYQSRHESACMVETSNEQFNDWLNRSVADLFMMITQTEYGYYPYAGIPWYNTIFGRDGIITAFETLWLYPDITRGVLSYLAARQAEGVMPEQEAEPGKILHEERKGEMARLKEIPFGSYYGTVDATPLFIVLAGYYYERTDDRDFIQQIWPNIERALYWIDSYGDMDKDGFVEYSPHCRDGLTNQGWKDSWDSVFHSDGSLAHPPIALCEVQGYVYEAKVKGAQLAYLLGKEETGKRLREEAEALRERFQRTFWLDELGTYALALDKEKQPCMVRSSNAGHCMFSGIAAQEHARILTRNLTGDAFFTGWGIRTIASSEARYNPMSYHNGSVWPHDNAIIAFGMSRYGFKDAVLKILTGLFEASIFLDLHRLPELFCGLTRRKGEGPTLYPVACDPQSWASGAIFLLLQACLGVSIQAQESRVYFNHPVLPSFLQEVVVRDLRIGSASLDIAFKRHEQDVSITVMRREGNIEVIVKK